MPPVDSKLNAFFAVLGAGEGFMETLELHIEKCGLTKAERALVRVLFEGGSVAVSASEGGRSETHGP
jgi:hypothetical protein